MIVNHIDPKLRQFATPEELKIIDAITEYGNQKKAAKALGLHDSKISRKMKDLRYRAATRGYAPDYDMVHAAPEGFNVQGTSTLYKDGEAQIQWVKTSIDKERQNEMMVEAIRGMAEDLPQLPPREPNDIKYQQEYMNVIPFGDPHFGMYAWAEETGNDFDLDTAKRDLCGAVDYLVSQAPAAPRCIIINLGDFFHADNLQGTTSKSGNVLDMDTRLPKVIRVGVAAIRQAIESALNKHEVVEIINVIGNHDEVLSMALSIMLANIYENEPRVIVHDAPTRRHYITHGKVMIGATHGDRSKDASLPGIMATERPEAWGQTKFRYFYRGHHHHKSVMEFNGCEVEQFRTLAPGDAYTVGGGWLSRSDMNLITHHKEYGEVSRITCSIELLRGLRLGDDDGV